MVRRFNVLVLVMLMLIFGAVPSLAGSVTGPTGLFRVPTADVNGIGTIDGSVHVVNNRVTAAINYALMDFVEIGASTRTSGQRGALVSAFAKGQIFPETRNDPGMAVGIEDSSAYVVFSKTMAPLFRGHFGIGTGRFNGLFGGVSYLLNPVQVSQPTSMQMPRIMLIGEYDGRQPNIGTRLSFAQGLDINIAWMNVEDVLIGASWRSRF